MRPGRTSANRPERLRRIDRLGVTGSSPVPPINNRCKTVLSVYNIGDAVRSMATSAHRSSDAGTLRDGSDETRTRDLRRDRPVLVPPGSPGIGGDLIREQGFSPGDLRELPGASGVSGDFPRDECEMRCCLTCKRARHRDIVVISVALVLIWSAAPVWLTHKPNQPAPKELAPPYHRVSGCGGGSKRAACRANPGDLRLALATDRR